MWHNDICGTSTGDHWDRISEKPIAFPRTNRGLAFKNNEEYSYVHKFKAVNWKTHADSHIHACSDVSTITLQVPVPYVHVIIRDSNLVITVATCALAPFDARPSAGTVLAANLEVFFYHYHYVSIKDSANSYDTFHTCSLRDKTHYNIFKKKS